MSLSGEDAIHVALLALTLVAGAAVILVLAPLSFDSPPKGLVGARPWLLALIGVTLGLYVLEWRVLH